MTGSSFLLFFLLIVVVSGWGILRGGGYWIIISVNCIDPGAGHTLNVFWVLMPVNHIRFCYLDFTVTFIELNNFNLTLAKTGFPWIVEVKREAKRGWVERENHSPVSPYSGPTDKYSFCNFCLGSIKCAFCASWHKKRGYTFFFKITNSLKGVSSFLRLATLSYFLSLAHSLGVSMFVK